MRRPISSQSGFSLVEMLTVVAVLAIVAAIAAPNMSQMVRAQRIKSASFDLYASLNFARAEAIKRNVNVTMTTSTGTNWANGWTITDANGTLLRSQNGWDALMLVGPVSVVFNGSGRATAAASFDVSAYNVNATKFRCVLVDLSGRAVTKEGACT